MAYQIISDSSYTINTTFQGTNELPIYAGVLRSDSNIIGNLSIPRLSIYTSSDIADVSLGAIDLTRTAAKIYITRTDNDRPARLTIIPIELSLTNNPDKYIKFDVIFNLSSLNKASLNAYATVKVTGTNVSVTCKVSQIANDAVDTTPFLIGASSTTNTGNFSLAVTAYYKKLDNSTPPVYVDTRSEEKTATFNASYRMNAYNDSTGLWSGTFTLTGSIPSAFSDADALNDEILFGFHINITNSAFTKSPDGTAASGYIYTGISQDNI